MTENWNMGLEPRKSCGLEGQKNLLDGTFFQSCDKPGRSLEWNSAVKDRTNEPSRRRQKYSANQQAWPKSSFSDPEQGTSSSSSCRDRMRNIKFTDEENDVLVTKVLENYPKLYGDDASRTSSFEKKRIWRGILESINCLGVSVRNIDTCKKRFADAKRYVRAKMNKHWGPTGPRTALNVYYTDWEEKIKAVLCPLGDGFPGIIDSADPSTYESPGYWSPPGNTSPEAQLSPEESVTPAMQFCTKTEVSENHKFQTTEKDFTSFKDHTVVNVTEEHKDRSIVMPSRDVPQNQDGLTLAQNFSQQHFSEAQFPPEESRTPTVQFIPTTQVSENHKFKTSDEKLSSFKVCMVENVKEEDDDGTSVMPSVGDIYQNQDSGFTSAHNFPKQHSPEAPQESVTPELQLYAKTEASEDHKCQIAKKELLTLPKGCLVQESVQGDDGTSMTESSQARFAPPQNFAEQHSEGEGISERDRLLYHGQAAFRRTLRRQLHAVRQEFRDFRREHLERMDLLLTLHRDHIAVEEQRNQILSQLVNTVNTLATKLSPADTGRDGQYLHSLTATSTSSGENDALRSNISQRSSSWISDDSLQTHREKRTMNGVPAASKKRK